MEPEGGRCAAAAQAERLPRYRRLLRATLVDAAGTAHNIIIRNVCERGIGATSPEFVPQREARVRIIVGAKITRDGTVRWSRQTGFGIEFDTPIDVRALTASGCFAAPAPAPSAPWSVPRAQTVCVATPDPRRLRPI